MTEESIKYRNLQWNHIIYQQLELSYYAHIPPEDTDSMSIFERDAYYSNLKDLKKKEAENMKKQKKISEQS